MESFVICWGCIGIMEKKMETTIIYWGYFRACRQEPEGELNTHLGIWGPLNSNHTYSQLIWSLMGVAAWSTNFAILGL